MNRKTILFSVTDFLISSSLLLFPPTDKSDLVIYERGFLRKKKWCEKREKVLAWKQSENKFGNFENKKKYKKLISESRCVKATKSGNCLKVCGLLLSVTAIVWHVCIFICIYLFICWYICIWSMPNKSRQRCPNLHECPKPTFPLSLPRSLIPSPRPCSCQSLGLPALPCRYSHKLASICIFASTNGIPLARYQSVSLALCLYLSLKHILIRGVGSLQKIAFSVLFSCILFTCLQEIRKVDV